MHACLTYLTIANLVHIVKHLNLTGFIRYNQLVKDFLVQGTMAFLLGLNWVYLLLDMLTILRVGALTYR